MEIHGSRFTTLEQFCAMQDISRTEVYRLNAQGKLTFVKRGRRTLVDLKSWDDYLASLPTFVSKMKTDFIPSEWMDQKLAEQKADAQPRRRPGRPRGRTTSRAA